MRLRIEGDETSKSVVLGNRIQINPNTGASTTSPYTSYPYISYYKRCSDEIHKNHPFQGGPFSLQTVRVDHSPWIGRTGYKLQYRTTGTWTADYRTGARISYPSPSDDYVPSERTGAAENYGAEAWSRFAPGQPKVGLNQFLGELRDFPQLFRASLKRFRDLGNLYLNAQFGWRPFLSDLMGTYRAFSKLDENIAKLRNEQNKYLKRRGSLFQTSSTSTTAVTNGTLYLSNDITAGGGTKITTTTSRCWFSGKFRYYITGLDDSRWGKWKAHQRIFGLDITPTLLWQLTPWSWLADWCSNAGAVINNFDRITRDHLVAKYAYIMLHELTNVTQVTYGTARYKEGYYDTATYQYTGCSAASTTQRETKTRVEATPFGFGLSWPDFSSFQLSILAALGLSRLKP